MPKKLACPTPLSKALREARRARGWTQPEHGLRAGIAERTVRHLERGRGAVETFLRALPPLGVSLRFRNAASLPLPEVVATLRGRRRISQRGLARLAGVSQPTIAALERDASGQLAPLERVLVALGAGAYLAPEGETRAFYSHAGVSSIGMAWETPADLLEVLYAAFGRFDLDPCSPRKDGPVRAKVRFTAADDGLSLPWIGRAFVNPPYGRALGAWVAKARSEFESGGASLVVLLIPARTDTAYWHEEIAGRAEVVFLKGRLRFGGAKQSAPFPSALAVYGAEGREMEELRRGLNEKRA